VTTPAGAVGAAGFPITVVVLPARGRPPQAAARRAGLEHVREDHLYAFWLLVATTGMRRGELAGLRWDDVDLEAGRLSVRQLRVVVANLPADLGARDRAGSAVTGA
jgi:integrase